MQKNDRQQWIQFSFDKERVISVVRTFGDRAESYVKTYSMQYSGDGETWIDYKQYGVKRVCITYVTLLLDNCGTFCTALCSHAVFVRQFVWNHKNFILYVHDTTTEFNI